MVQAVPDEWDVSTDVIVIGSGSGLVAALAAHEEGADVHVVERAPVVGGTTAVSNAGIWLPNADPIVDEFGATPTEELHRYIRRVAGDYVSSSLIGAFLTTGPEMLSFIERATNLTFEPRLMPDYHPEWPGGSRQGQSVRPALFDGSRLGSQLETVRENPHSPIPASSEELAEAGGFAKIPIEMDEAMIRDRIENDVLDGGRALVAGLYEACLDRGVEFLLDTRATELVLEGDRDVQGVVVESGAETQYLAADAVIVATGGFEWDEEMCASFLRGPMDAPASPPCNEGDGIVMGMDIGARVRNMNEAWWFPTAHVGQHWADGSPIYRMVWQERALPGSLMVNAAGDRFVNESGAYHDISKAFHHFDPGAYEYSNVPAYVIFDQQFRDQYALFSQLRPSDPTPDWLVEAETIASLASRLDVDSDALKETVHRFNDQAVESEDPDFGRGRSPHDREIGDEDASHPNLAPLAEPPFYAFEVRPGSLGTKGGLVTTPDGTVRDVHGDSFRGLYAAGNTTAHVMGIGYAGPGATLGPNMTFAYRAGRHAGTDTAQPNEEE